MYLSWIVIFYILMVVACCNPEDDGVLTTTQIDVTNPVDTLNVVLELGDLGGDSTEIFGSIIDADIDQQGRIFVLDEVFCCLKVYDIQGNYIRQVSRRGSGPGESFHPRSMFIMPDGRIGICASDKAGFIVFDDSLEYEEEIRFWLENSPYHVTPITNSRIAVSRYTENSDSSILRHTLSVYEWGEDEREVLLWKDSIDASIESIANIQLMFRFAFIDLLCSGGTGDGAVYFSPSNPYNYSVYAWDSTGAEILHITRDMESVEKTIEEIDDEIFQVCSQFQTQSGRELPFPYQPNPYRDLIISADIGPDGNLWVRRGTHLEPFFDIYDLEGNLLRHAVFPAEGWSWQTETTASGILAWELDPEEGYQKLYLLDQ